MLNSRFSDLQIWQSCLFEPFKQFLRFNIPIDNHRIRRVTAGGEQMDDDEYKEITFHPETRLVTPGSDSLLGSLNFQIAFVHQIQTQAFQGVIQPFLVQAGVRGTGDIQGG